MMKKILLILLLVVAVGLVGGLTLWKSTQSPNKTKTVPENQLKRDLTPEIEEIVSKKTTLITDLVKNQIIIAEVKKSGEKDKNLSATEIASLDQKWQKTEGVDNFIRAFLTNATAKELIKFQEENPEFTEIFVTNTKGLNVGQTNKTSDYLQGDEDWWINSYNQGKGKISHGEIEYDESSQTESIAIYVPVIDLASKQAIGIIKAILDINVIKSEL